MNPIRLSRRWSSNRSRRTSNRNETKREREKKKKKETMSDHIYTYIYISRERKQEREKCFTMEDDDANDHPANSSGGGGGGVVARSLLFNNDFFFSSMSTFVASVLLLSAATAVAVVIITNNKNLGILIFMVLYVTIVILWKKTKYCYFECLITCVVTNRCIVSSSWLLFSSIYRTHSSRWSSTSKYYFDDVFVPKNCRIKSYNFTVPVMTVLHMEEQWQK